VYTGVLTVVAIVNVLLAGIVNVNVGSATSSFDRDLQINGLAGPNSTSITRECVARARCI
jgi:hypothetical protein